MMNGLRERLCARDSRGMSSCGSGLLLAGVALLSIVIPVQANAQTADQPRTVGDIIVTAQKREQSLQSVPVSIQAVTGESITEQGVVGLAELSVPSLHISAAGLSEQLYIRGIGSGSNQGFEQSVGLFLDGIALGVPRLSRLAFLDVGRVEVLKGPQSTLFGKSTIGGAVSIISGQPQFEPEVRVTGLVDIDGDTRRSIEGHATGPLTDRVAVRVAGKFLTTDGAFRNTLTDRRQPHDRNYSARLSLLANATDTFEVFGSLQFTKADGHGRSAQVGIADDSYPIVTLFKQRVLALDPAADFTPDRFRSATTQSVPVDCDECFDDRAVLGTLRLTLDIGSGRITSLTGYLDSKWSELIDADASPLPLVTTHLGQKTRQFSEELRIESNEDQPLTYIGGAYFQSLRVDAANNCSDFGLASLNPALPNIRSCATSLRNEKTMGAFAQLTWAPVKQLRLTAGARYQVSDRKVQSSRVVANPGTLETVNSTDPVVLAGAMGVLKYSPYEVQRSADDARVTPSFIIEWDPIPGVLVYGSYRTGFKQGGFDVQIGSFDEVDFQYAPEKATSWEAGFKARLFDGRGRFNLNYFRSTFDNLQLSSWNGFGFTVGNAAKARSTGVEMEADFEIIPGIQIGGDLTYLDAKYLSYPGAACYSNQTAAEGCIGGIFDRAGDRLAYSPKWAGNVHLNIRQQLTQGLVGFASGRATFRSKQAVAPDGDPNFEISGVTVWDLRAGLGSADDRWELAVVGRNITNKHIPAFGFGVPVVRGAYVLQLEQPRVISIQGTVRF